MDTLTTGISDRVLITECLDGDQQAWIQLLKRYKRLIYSVAVRFQFESEDRHDVFQAVCLETLKSLPSLRDASSLRYWILTITVRQCSLLQKRRRAAVHQQPEEAALTVEDPRADTMRVFLAAEREKVLHEAMEELPAPCRCLLDLLFFSDDKTSYLQAGEAFGWSKNSIGSVRIRCLDKLRKILEGKGF